MFNLHYQNSKYNWELAKCHTRPNKENWKHEFSVKGFLNLEPKEVLEKTSLLGWTRTQRTLQLYVKEGLVPKPTTKGAGRGKIADYPENAPVEFFASLELINKRRNVKGGKLTFKDAKEIRDIAININKQKPTVTNFVNEKGITMQKTQTNKDLDDMTDKDLLAEAWLLNVLQAQSRLKKLF